MRVYSHSRYPVPSAWETLATASRSQVALQYLKVEDLRVRYVGPGETDGQAAAIITNYPSPADCPLFYFEVEIISKGREGFIGVGFQTDDVTLARLPGWEQHSYGYHGDDGHVFTGSGRGQQYACGFTTGDVIGALLNRAEKTISFFKNGVSLGVAFTNVSEERLHPCVGLRSQGEEVQANFGGQPFRVDFEAMATAFRNQVLASVASVPLPLVGKSGAPLLPQLLYDHLMHHRCSATAAIIARDLLRGQAETSTSGSSPTEAGCNNGNGPGGDAGGPGGDVECRQRVYELVTAGLVQEAVHEVERRYSRAPLDSNPGLDFQLKVAQFCELVRGCDASCTDAALAFGRQVLAPHKPKGPAEDELLSDALSLLAYERPECSPCGYLLNQEWRVTLAEALNGAILKHQGLPSVSPLERIFQQATLVLSELQQANHPQAVMFDLQKLVVAPAASGSRKRDADGTA